ncbi:Rad52/Rad22 family DNA repair protein [Chelativorans sp. Marseille-P2723]|uniref:Rad52/Rad22 family DNA repair protein n=1 Tax=Chelativorans sp. Marseille-P2723 TaxID=2709133 RepID=UPI0015702F1C|nr:Rad52/Rad22 family DNA repair protein [Chelativorans sp. Marseille-P2723]
MSCTVEDIKKLFAEFPPEDVHWRAQTVTRDGTKALALAYLDARDVMDRLDSVCGPENWQDRYEFNGPRTVCYLSIRIDGEWITKADGAGDTAVEAEKGALSDALKRAAVKWGIGRYLYALGDTWVPCESRDVQGRKQFVRFKDDPWRHTRPIAKAASAASQKRGLAEIEDDLLDCATIAAVDQCADEWRKKSIDEGWSRDFKMAAAEKFKAARERIAAQEKEAA